MNKFSNILKIPSFSDYNKDMLNKIANKIKILDPSSDVPMFSTSDKKLDDMMLVDIPTNFGISAQYDEGKFEVKCINELGLNDEKFVLHLNVVSIFPQTIFEYVSVMCENCQMR